MSTRDEDNIELLDDAPLFDFLKKISEKIDNDIEKLTNELNKKKQ